MSRLIDITGKKFNRLTVIERVGKDKRGESLWKCRCDCGSEIVILSSNLRTGHTKSCGCISRLDLTGHTYGELTVIEFVEIDDKKSSVWRCKCSCGNEALYTTKSLHYGTKTCGKCIRVKYDIQGDITIGTVATGQQFIIDTKVLPLIKNYNWHFGTTGYIERKATIADTRTSISLHRQLMQPSGELKVDHINRIKTDNRLSNLRVCTQQQNATNVGIICTNTSGYKGVSQVKNGRFRAYTDYKGKRYHLGTFDTAEEAALYRDMIVKRWNGDFAWLNFDEERVVEVSYG